MNDPLVSILIPAYNHEQYIEECIQSIVNQTYDNLEIIVSDDGSTDNTYQKLLELELKYKNRFERFLISHHANIGVAASLNFLLSKASGEYILIIASDDKMKPFAIRRLYDFLSRNKEYVLVVGDNEIINSKSRRIYWDKLRNSVEIKHASFSTLGQSIGADRAFANGVFGAYSELLKNNHVPNGYLIRRESFREIGGYNDLYPEDWNLHLQLSKIGKFRFIKDILFSYRWHDSNTVKSKKYYLKLRRDRKKQLLNEYAWCLEHNLLNEWNSCWKKEFSFFGWLKYLRKTIIQINFRRGKVSVKIFRKRIL